MKNEESSLPNSTKVTLNVDLFVATMQLYTESVIKDKEELIGKIMQFSHKIQDAELRKEYLAFFDIAVKTEGYNGSEPDTKINNRSFIAYMTGRYEGRGEKFATFKIWLDREVELYDNLTFESGKSARVVDKIVEPDDIFYVCKTLSSDINSVIPWSDFSKDAKVIVNKPLVNWKEHGNKEYIENDNGIPHLKAKLPSCYPEIKTDALGYEYYETPELKGFITYPNLLGNDVSFTMYGGDIMEDMKGKSAKYLE